MRFDLGNLAPNLTNLKHSKRPVMHSPGIKKFSLRFRGGRGTFWHFCISVTEASIGSLGTSSGSPRSMVSNLSIKIRLPCVVEVLWTKQFFLVTSHISKTKQPHLTSSAGNGGWPYPLPHHEVKLLTSHCLNQTLPGFVPKNCPSNHRPCKPRGQFLLLGCGCTGHCEHFCKKLNLSRHS